MKKYIEVYNYYKKLIENGQLKQNDKMPSIRESMQILSVSKTTILNAYFELQADGYIIASPKSGYYVTQQRKKESITKEINSKENRIIYDFKSGDAEKECFDLKLWQRYIKSALRQEERMLSYGDVQGEYDLIQAIADYIKIKRNVITSPDRIVVGYGVQSLLSILGSLLRDKKSVSFPDSSFVAGMNLFENYGFDIHTRYKDADIIYVSPSHMTSYGNVMPINRRIELVKYSEKNNSIIIEDDYDSDFVYQSKPTPSLFALATNDNVVYMGSFSNVLIPGIRISYMVLTEELTKRFNENKDKFAQTASKTEQIALCQYIRDGHINTQTRKVRRQYTTKAKQFYDLLSKSLNNAKVSLSENGLQVIVKTKYYGNIDEFENNGIALNIVSYENNTIQLSLVTSAVNEKDFEKAIKLLKSILE